MDNLRLILFVAMSMLGLMLWEAWQGDYGRDGTPETLPSSALGPTRPAADQPPAIPSSTTADALPVTQPATLASQSDAPTISVTTDVFEARIDSLGAGLQRVALVAYPVALDQPNEAVALFNTDNGKTFIYQGGLAGEGTLPNHHQLFACDQGPHNLGDSAEELTVACRWQHETGLRVEKRFRFRRGEYVVGVEYEIANQTGTALRLHHYEQLKRNEESSRQGMIYTFTGPVLSTPEKRFKKFDFDDLTEAPLAQVTPNGWVGIIQHYFASALVPPPDSPYQYYSKIVDSQHYIVGLMSPAVSLDPGETRTLSSRIFIGPKRHDLLNSVAPALELTVDYGMLWFIAKPLFLVLRFFHELTGNWGWAIILLTCLLKLMFYPLSAAGYRSMANMRRVQPRMLALRDRYSDDRAQLNQAMMSLYKEEKINPLGGCLPILIQIPVFIALYWVLLETVEMRQAPFVLWINDLSTKDPFFVLPLLMGISMWLQQKLNPAPLDPMQAKVMQIMPFVFTVFFAFFPAGLVLYWLVNNVLSIAQQWRITKLIEAKAS